MKTIGRDILFGGKGASVFIEAIDATDLAQLMQDPGIDISFGEDAVIITRVSDGAVLQIPLESLTSQQVIKLKASFAAIVPAAGETSPDEAAPAPAKTEGDAKTEAKAAEGETQPAAPDAANASGNAQQAAPTGEEGAQAPAVPEGNLEQTLDSILAEDAAVEIQALQSGKNLGISNIGYMGGNIGSGGSTQMGLDGGSSAFALSRMSGASMSGGASRLGGGYSSSGYSSGGGSSGGGGGGGGDGSPVVVAPSGPGTIASVASIATPSSASTEGVNTSMAFTVSLSEMATENIIVSYRTTFGTAGTNDFTATTSTLLIPMGNLSGTLNVALTDDARYEHTENFTVEIISAQTVSGQNVLINPAASVATGTINDNDTAPTVTISPVTVTEGANAVFTVTLDKLSDVPVTGNWSVLAGTAGPGDFGGSLPNGTFTIPAGSLTATITIGTNDDAFSEVPENFSLTLTGITGAQNTSIGVIGTINDNELGVTFTSGSQSVNESAGTATVQVGIAAPHPYDVVVTYRTVVGSANGSDFTSVITGTTTIPAGSTSANITVNITNDTLFEGGAGTFETFNVEITNAVDTNGVTLNYSNAPHTVQIIDNDTIPTLTLTPVLSAEGDAMVFTVTASHPSINAITGNWSLLAGTANAADFGGTFPSGSFTIPAGATSTTISFASLEDVSAEANETFTLVLDGISNAQSGPISTIGTIINDDFSVNLGSTVITVNEGAGTASVTVSLNNAYSSDITVTYRTISGTAGTGDFTSTTSSTIVIPAGSTSATISIPVTNDTMFDGGDESFDVEIIGAVDASSNVIPLGQTTQTVTIVDNEIAPTLTMSPVSQSEGGAFTFTVTATHASDSPITGNWSLLAGTATAADFGGAFPSGTFTIPAGATTATISFASLDDSVIEGNENFTLVLDSIVNAQGGSVSAGGTILNNDFGLNLGGSTITVNEGAGSATATVTINAPYAIDITITYRTVAGTAGAADYTATASSTIVIPAGATSATISVPITNDTMFDGGDESFQIEIIGAVDTASNPIPVGQATQTVTIVDNEVAPTLSMSSVSQTEGGAFTFTVTATHASDSPITGNWSLMAGTASAADFGGTFPSGTFTIPAGSTTATISFASLDDLAIEGNETFTLALDSIVNAQGGSVSASGTILNNDFAVGLGGSVITVNESDGTASVTVSINAPYATDITVTYRTVAGTAGASDFTATASSTIVIPAGATSATISVPITNDTLYDVTDESFQIEILGAVDTGSNPIAVGQATQTITIVDNETAPTLTLSPVSQVEGGTFTFTVTASRASDSPITGNWTLQSGTADAADFGGSFPSGTFTIAPGATSATIILSSLDDVLAETNETFTLVLDTITNAQAGPVSTTGTIVNNDFALSITATPVSVNEGDGSAQIGVSLNGAHTQDITITYRTIRVSAQSSDFTEASLSTITIPAGQTTGNILVNITDDVLYDGGNETFQVEIISAQDTGGQNVAVSSSTQTVTIIDNELAPSLSMGNVTQTEGGVFTFTVTASHASDSAISGNWTIQAGAANAADFGGTLPGGTFTIAPGSTTATITFSSSNDTVLEGNETFTLLLDTISGAQTTPVLATGTIANDDFGVNIDVAAVTVGEGDGTVPVTFTISAPYAQDVTITYRTVAGTATGADYTAVSSATIVIPAGQTSITANITLTNDTLYDQGNENFTVEIVSARDVSLNNIPVGQATQTVTIVDNEAAPTLTIAPVSGAEGSTLSFTVTASHAADGPITGTWSLAAGTANAADFGGVLPTGTFTIPAGSTTAIITIPTTQDVAVEINETFTLQLDTIVGAQSGSVSAIGTIVNDDFQVHFSQTAESVTENNGNHVARVDLSAVYNHDITITYRTVAVSATGADYTAVGSGTITIPAGQYYANITVPITNDTIYEGSETFQIEILSAVDATTSAVIPLGNNVQTVTITDNETTPVLSVADVNQVEGGNFVYTLTLSTPSTQTVTGNWEILAGTANAADFGGTLPSGTFTIPAGSTTATITIGTVNDTISENLYETFSLRLHDVINTTQSTVIANGTIEDNDVQVFVSSTGQTVAENAGTATITFSLNRTSATDITINYRTLTGTANGQDFTEVAGASVVIPAGQTSVSFTVSVTDDNLFEGGAENFAVSIVSAQDSFASPISIGTNNTHTINITDNDVAPTLTLTPAGVTEGGDAIFTVTANRISSQSITGTWAVGAGTANAADFGGVLPTGTFTIAAGQLTTTITVHTADDIAQEGGENFSLTIDNINGAQAGPVSTTGTIADNEMAVSMSLSSSTVNENAGTVTMTVNLSQVHSHNVIVGYRTVSGTADGSDYVAIPTGTITILAGQTSATITITLNDDTIYDGGNESFQVQLLSAEDSNSQPISVGAGTHTVTLIDNETAPVLTMGDLIRTEGNSFTFTITSSGTSDVPITGNWAVAAGTASATDFGGVLPTGTFTIPVGQTSATLTFSTFDDVIQEGSETFTVGLSSIVGANTSTVTANGIIQDNELSVAFSLGSSAVSEGAGVAPVTISISQAVSKDVTIHYRTVTNTAGATDFTQVTNSAVIIPAGQTSATINIGINNDIIYDGAPERFDVELISASDSDGVNIPVSVVHHQVLINDNDAAPTVSLSNMTINENGTATFTITRTGDTDENITGDWQILAGTASAADFGGTLPSGTFTILPGQTSITVSVTTSDDLLAEGNETFTISVGNLTNSSTSTATSTGTIIDDELYIDYTALTGIVSEAGGTYNATIQLNRVHSHNVTITYSTVAGTAGSSDYTVVSTQTVTILAGQTTVQLPVTITEDFLVESSETFQIVVNSAVDATTMSPVVINHTTHNVTITDNDIDLNISLASVNTNVAENAGTVAITINLNTAHNRNVTITYNTSNGTATAGSDYTGSGGNQTVTIPAGQTSVTINVPITNDSLYESTETFNVNLVSAVDQDARPISINGATLHQVHILDNDTIPTLSINNAPSPENTDYVFVIQLSAPASQSVTGTWTFQPGTATAADFNNGSSMPSGNFTILAGATTATITVPVKDDVLSEGYENFNIRLDNITGADATPVIKAGQLVDDELSIGFTSTTASVTEGGSHTGIVEMSFSTLEDVVVSYQIIGTSATAGSDFVAATGTVTIPAGQTTASILAQTIQDTNSESDEQFKIRLTGVSTTGPITPVIPPAAQEQLITIEDDELDPAITLTVPGFVNENGGAQIVSVERSATSSVSNSVNVRFDGAGFTVTYNSVTYNPGQIIAVTFTGFLNSQNITFNPVNNALNQGDSTVTVTLSDPVNARLPSTSYAFSLLDDEASTTEVYGYGSPGPVIDGDVHGALVGDDGRNVLSIGETVIASIVRDVLIDPKSGIDQVRIQTQTGVHHILDNTVLAGADGRAIIELSTGAAGDSIVSGNKINASAKGDDIIALRTLGGKVGQISGNEITMAQGTFVGADGTNDFTASALNGNAGTSGNTQNSVGTVNNNVVTGGDGDDIVTIRTAGNTAGAWANDASNLLSGSYGASGVSAVMLKDGGYAVASTSGTSIHIAFMNMDGSARSGQTVSTSNASQVEIVTLANGNVLVAYFRSAASDIYIRTYAPDGTAVTSEVALITANSTQLPKIAAMADGGYLLTYYDASVATASVIRYNASGTQVASDTITQAGAEYYTDVAALRSGGYVLTWYNDTAGNNVYFQRYNADNTKAGGIVTVAGTSAGEYTPQVKALKDGGFVVTWYYADPNDSSNQHIRASVYNADSTLRSGNIVVSTTQNITDNISEIVPLSDGGFIVTTHRNMIDYYYDTTADTFMTRFDKNGVMVGNEVRLGSYVTPNELFANIVEMRDGNLLALYYDSHQGGVVQRTITPPGASLIQGNDFILGDGANRLIVDAQSGTGRASRDNDGYDQNSGGSGSVIGGNRITTGAGVDEILLTSSSGVGGNAATTMNSTATFTKQWLVDSTAPMSSTDYGVSVSSLADGGFAIVWSETVSGYDIFLQRYDRNGNQMGAQVTIRDDGANNLQYPTIVGLADGGYVVSWDFSSTQIQYKIYNADNTLRQDVQTLNFSASTDYNSDMTALSDGGFILVWSEENSAAGNYHRIHTARFDENGAQISDQSILAPSGSSAQHAMQPEVVSMADGGYLVSWVAAGNYAEWQRFDAGGEAVSGVIRLPGSINSYKAEIIALANGNILVTQNYASSTSSPMYIYNAGGQIVQQISPPHSYLYRSEAMPLADGGFVLLSWDATNSYLALTRYAIDGTIIGSMTYVQTASSYTTDNSNHAIDIAAVGEDGFVVTWEGNNGVYASLYKFDDSFNVGGDASVVENNTVSTFGNDDVITLSTSGGVGGQAQEGGSSNNGASLITAAGDASVVQNNVVDSGDGTDVVTLSATGGTSNYTRIDGLTAQVLGNTVTTGLGNDQVNITASGGVGNYLSNRVANNTVTMGDGNDSLTSFSTHFINNTIDLGAGANNSATVTAQFINSNAVNSTAGDDSVTFNGVRTAHENQINLGAGNDIFTLNSSAAALGTFSGSAPPIDHPVRSAALNVPKTTALSNGNYVTSWTENVSGGSNNVYAQIFNSKGQAVSAVLDVAVSGNSEYQHAITATANGSFVVAWNDNSVQNSYIKKFDAAGTQMGSTVTIPDSYNNLAGLDMTTLTNGKIAIVQWEYSNPWGYYSFYHTILNADLTTSKSVAAVNSSGYFWSSGYHAYGPSILATSDGGYIISGYYGANAYAYMDKYNAAGSYVASAGGNNAQVYNSTSFEHPVKTVELNNGNIVLYGMNGSSVIASVYNSSFGLIANFTVSGNGYYPEILATENGFIVYSTNSGGNLYTTVYNINGTLISSTQLLLTAPAGITQIEVDKVGDYTVLSYTAGDKIYQQITSVAVTASVTGLELDLGDGTNQTSVTTNYYVSNQISSGSGDDTITLNAGIRAIQNTVTMGDGVNSLTVNAGETDIWTITGSAVNDTVAITATQNADRQTIDLKNGANALTMTSALSMDTLDYDGGTGTDTIVLTSSGSTIGQANINTGAAGNDTITMTAGASINSLILTSGSGDDTLDIIAGGTVTSATINMGNGVNDADIRSTGSSMNSLNFTSGTGNDTVLLRAAGTMNNAVIALGAGTNDFETILTGGTGSMTTFGLTTGNNTDIIDITTSQFISGATLQLGDGANTVNVTTQTSGQGITSMAITGTAGVDNYTLTSAGAIDTSTFTLGAGNNSLYMRANNGTMATLNATGLAGNDALDIRSTGNMNNATVNLGDGTNTMDIRSTGGTMNVAQFTTGIGDDTIYMSSSSTMNNATILTSSGNDTLTMVSGGTITDAVINLGIGDNAATFSGTINNMQFTSGSNNDTLVFNGGTMNSGTFNLGIGNSSMTITSGVANFNGVTYTTGSGVDTVSIATNAAGNSFSLGSGADVLSMRAIGNNTISLGIQTNVIDTLVLTNTGSHALNALGGQVTGVEMVSLNNSGAQTVVVDRSLALQADNYGGQKILFIKGGSNDIVNIIKGPGTIVNPNTTQEFDGVTYRVIEQNEGTPVYFFIQQGMTIQVDGGPLTFDNPIAADLAAMDIDTSAMTVAVSSEEGQAQGQTQTQAAPVAANDIGPSTKVISYALFGGSGEERVGGPMAQVAAQIFAFYQAALQARGLDIVFVEAKQEDASMFSGDADISIGLGNEILGNVLADPNSVLGISAGQEGEAMSMLLNAPNGAGIDVANLTGDVFLSDAFLKLASMDAAHGGGVHQGSLAYYVLMQEIGHSLGLEERSDEELAAEGYDAATAHEATTTDETVDGLDSIDDLEGMTFASTPGEAALDNLAQTMQEEFNAQTHADNTWIEPDYASIADLIAQFSHDPDSTALADQFQTDQALQDFMSSYAQGSGLETSASDLSSVDALLHWAQDNVDPMPNLPANDAGPAASSPADTGPSFDQIAADVAYVPPPEEQDAVHA